MKANELRLNNWIKDHDYDYAVDGEGDEFPVLEDTFIYIRVDLDVLEVLSLNEGICYLPIPLTPEILEKCGFEKASPICYELWVDESEYSKYVFYWNAGDGLHVGYDGGSYGRKIEYLHDLQNRYFSLTGEELNIDLQDS